MIGKFNYDTNPKDHQPKHSLLNDVEDSAETAQAEEGSIKSINQLDIGYAKLPLNQYSFPGFNLSVNKPMCFKLPRLIKDKNSLGDRLNSSHTQSEKGSSEYVLAEGFSGNSSTLPTDMDDEPLHDRKVRFRMESSTNF